DGPLAEINSNTAKTTRGILGTDNDRLYQSERYAKNLSYYIPVANGTYDVNLHFAEIFWSGEGNRIFDITIEGEMLHSSLDIYAATGKHQALQLAAETIVVTDGRLDIQLSTISDHAKLSGLEVFTKSLAETVSDNAIDNSIEEDAIAREETVEIVETLRVNAGGERYVDSNGHIWLADAFFDGGKTTYKYADISNTKDDVLYRSERYAKNLTYAIPVANGIYDLNLLMAEIYWSQEGARIFDVAVEGDAVVQDLDIHDQVAKNRAFNQQISTVEVTDGVLNIALSATQDKAKLAGLEITTVEIFAEEPSSEASQGGLILPEGPSDPSEPNATNNPALGPTPLTDAAVIRYIAPNGTGDGSSWQDAAQLAGLDALIEKSAPGDEIWIAGDLGTYDVAGQTIVVDSGGTATAPVFIRGVSSKLGDHSNEPASDGDTPLFVGDRAENWVPGKANGGEVFRLLNGANHLHFSGFNFRNVGNGAFRLGGDITDITLEDMAAENVRRFVENTASSGATTASVSDLIIRNVDIRGFSKNAIRLQYDTHDVLIEDVLGDSEGQDGDSFAMGVHLDGSVHNVVHRRVTMNNAIQTKADNQYWNADGFVTEKNTYNITYEDTYAAGSTDGGYDLKSNNTLLIRAGAADNKRNFRFWGTARLIDVVSDDPIRRGGTGTDAHIHVLGDGNVTIEGGRFTGDRAIDNIIFDLDDNANLVVNDAVITDDLYTLHTVQNGTIQLNNVVEA
ncbi:MAG: malectin domain-containing carbohydrate-binding protein, partial [Cyanobacteria bacterium J06598_3]